MIWRWSNRLFDVLRAQFRRGALFLLAFVAAGALTLTPVLTPTANADGLTDILSTLVPSTATGSTSCAIDMVGWVICPTMRTIAKLADYGFTYINKSFLRVDYSIASNDSGTYTAWGMMRNIANALFVVAFMILVYSQLTGRSGGNYTIKRLLPRLIICAILVNISYYICVGIIDISNILGDSIETVLTSVADKVGTSIMPLNASPSTSDGTLTTITSQVLGKTGTVWVLLAPIAAVIVSIAMICAVGVVLLIMRKTVISVLILASPILFVAYLLPNLERYFQQAARLFAQLLLLYPIVAILLGAGQIVSATIVTTGVNDANYRVSGDSYNARNGGSGSAITDATAAAAAVLPLLAVWFIFKNMSSLMSTAGSRLSASLAGRRGGGKDDEKARVTGNATAGAANNKNVGGIGGFNRRQAYSRNRHHASLGGSSMTGDEESGLAGRAGQANRQSGTQNAAQNALDSSIRGEGSEDAAEQLEELQNARVNGQTDQLDIGSAVAGALSSAEVQAKGDKEKDKVTAKDLFNNLNRSHESKDKDRKFNSGPAPAGGGGGNGGGGSSSSSGGNNQPSAPVVGYKAPQMAQSGNIVSGTSMPKQVTRVVAVPVQIDASALLGQNQNLHQPPENISQPPISGTEEKAKARAQKYLFDTERDLTEARDKQDILGKKDDTPTEQPHIAIGSSENHDKDS